jgi:hypothetical protein
MATEAGVTCSVELLQELVSMFARLRAARAHVERTVAPAEPTQRLPVSTQPSARHGQNVSAPPDHSTGAETSGWSAWCRRLCARSCFASTPRSRDFFGVEDVRKICGPVEEMAPITAHSTELLWMQPALAGQLDLYKSQLGELQVTLGQIRVMLLARQASLEAGRAQLTAVSQWMGAFRQTRWGFLIPAGALKFFPSCV